MPSRKAMIYVSPGNSAHHEVLINFLSHYGVHEKETRNFLHKNNIPGQLVGMMTFVEKLQECLQLGFKTNLLHEGEVY